MLSFVAIIANQFGPLGSFFGFFVAFLAIALGCQNVGCACANVITCQFSAFFVRQLNI